MEERAEDSRSTLEKSRQYEKDIEAQAGHISKLQADFSRLEWLLKDYYLDMDLPSVENPQSTNIQRCSSTKSGHGKGKDGPQNSHMMTQSEMVTLPKLEP